MSTTWSTRCVLAAAVLAASGLGVSQGETLGPKVHNLFRAKPGSTALFGAKPAKGEASTHCPGTPVKGIGKSKAPTWTQWRERSVRTLLTHRYKIDNEDGIFLDPDQVMFQSVAIANVLDDCLPEDFSSLAPQLGNLRKFTAMLRNNTDVYHQFGHGGPDGPAPSVTDEDYLGAVKDRIDLPALLKSPEFLNKVSRKAGYRAAWDMVAEHNKTIADPARQWKPLIYRSQFLGTPDPADAFGRFFVMVPGEVFDQWIQFGIWTPGEEGFDKPVQINNLSVVAVDKAVIDGQRFTALADLWRVYDDTGAVVELKTRRQATGVTGNCLQCHKVSPLPIYPEVSFSFNGNDLVPATQLGDPPERMAEALRKYSRDTYRGGGPKLSVGAGDDFADPRYYGPPLGPDIPVAELPGSTRNDKFMRQCTAKYKLKPEAVTRVQRAMNCAECHHAESRGAINFPQATQTTRSTRLTDETWPNLVYAHIKNAWMPLKGIKPTTGDEREALFDCLVQEYYDAKRHKGLLVDWLNNVPVKAAATKPTPPKPAGGLMLKNAIAAANAPLVASKAGAALFDETCGDCHLIAPGANDEGPSLFGVVNRRAGSVPGYAYSPSYVEAGAAGLVWDGASLMDYLVDQKAFLSNRLGHPARSMMANRFTDEGLRKRIVEYLMTLK